MINKYFSLLIGLFLFSLVFLGLVVYDKESRLTEKDYILIDAFFENVKPQCIGRFVVDIPIPFNNMNDNQVFIDDFKIESKFIYPPAFKQRIELREQELRNGKTSEKNAPVLKEIIQLPDGKGVIFDRNKSGSDDSYRTLEAHVYTELIAFIITVNIRDFSDEKYEKKKVDFLARGFSEIQANDKPTKLAAMQSLISRLSGRKNEDIPGDNGVCIPNGFIADDGNKYKEIISFTYENADFILGFRSDNTAIGSDDTLFNRSPQINEAMSLAKKNTIKKEKLSPNGIPSLEWLMVGKQNKQEDNDMFEFILYSNEKIADSQKPLLYIGLNNADKNTQYSQWQMVEIWDRIVGSLRYKPNAF
ncbi:T6SS immunity protein Tli4 family protein [Moellerella wisconsensis]|uniref:T6SS immunity protein Tli4 family protein n=1 Tax=Moellerella wisconsensis TaxID=158849 RepID=UPI001F4F08D4|nr:T6SS immunity protein Tli4 family protein [Moellerella wisconsensis]UNH26959.1 T6SS immunity protein Tli4 family protein [Moellerella wisconsensis]